MQTMRILVLLYATLVGFVSGQDAKGATESEELLPLNMFSLSPPYIDEHISNKNWNFGGDAFMNVNEYVRLTQSQKDQRGWLWSKQQVAVDSWVVEFEFKVHGESSVPGDGFAFWYTDKKEEEGKVFGSVDRFTGLGVFFDTYMNGAHSHTFPLIMGMVGDGKTSYDISTDGRSKEIGSCAHSLRNKDWPTKARIRYVRPRQLLQVYLNTLNTPDWEVCFSVANVSLPTAGYFGLTAHTGDVYDIHDIIRFSAKSINHPNTVENVEILEHGDGVRDDTSGFSVFLWVLMGIACIGVFVYLYAMRAQRRYKRF